MQIEVMEEDNASTMNGSTQELHRHPVYLTYMNLVLTAISIVGTSILLMVITAQRRRTKLALTTSMALSVLLSIDLLFLLISCAGSVFIVVDIDIVHHQSSAINLLYHIFYWIPLTLQGYVQCVVSLERVIAIVSPLDVKRIVTKRRMMAFLVFVILIISVWQSVFIVATSRSFTNSEDCDQTFSETPRCHKKKLLRMLDTVNYAVIRCGPPLLLLLGCSFWIIYYLKKSRRSVADGSQTRKAREFRLAVVLVTIDIIFIISTTPNYILEIVNEYLGGSYESVTPITEYLRGLGALTDWLVLLCLGRHVRLAVLRSTSGCLLAPGDDRGSRSSDREEFCYESVRVQSSRH